jgi:hypothetical protein
MREPLVGKRAGVRDEAPPGWPVVIHRAQEPRAGSRSCGRANVWRGQVSRDEVGSGGRGPDGGAGTVPASPT